MENNPLVSVCIPMYNAENYIEDTINSLIKQTYKNIEIIIIDDGSSDKSIDIVNSFEDTRIKLFKNKKNEGLPYTRNRSIDLAIGKYIALIDADDIAESNRIFSQVRFMENNKEYGVVYSYIRPFGNINLLSKFRIKKLFNKNLVDKEIKSKLFFYNVICNPSSMIRKSVLNEKKIRYREEYTNSQDYGFWIDLINETKFYVIKKKLLKYRFGHENVSKKSASKKYDIHCKLSKQLLEKLDSEEFTSYDYKILAIIYLKQKSLFEKNIEDIDLFLCKLRNIVLKSDLYFKDELLLEIERQRYYFSLYYKKDKVFKDICIRISDKSKIFIRVRLKQIFNKLNIL